MELEFQKVALPYLKPVLREVQNQEQTQEVRLSDGMPDVGRILAGWGQVILRSKEWRSDTISFSGGVMAWVLYAPEDGSEPRTLESWVPFQMKWDMNDNLREGDIRIQCLLRSVDARSISARRILLRCNVAALAEAYVQENAEIPVPGDLPEDIQLLKSTYPVQIPKAAGEKTFLLDEELTLPGSAPLPEKLIYYSLEPRVTDGKIQSGKVVFRGSGDLHVLYLSEEGKLHSWDHAVLFSQFADVEGNFGTDALADIRMGVTSLEVELDPQGHLRLKGGLLAQYVVDDRENLELIEDAYSPLRQVSPDREELELPVILEQKRMNVTFQQSVQQEAREIADVNFLPDFPKQRRGDSVNLEIPGQFQVLFYGGDGALQSAAPRTEETIEQRADENSRIDAVTLPGDRPTAMTGGSVELRGDAQVLMTTGSLQGIPMVTGLELGEMKTPDNSRPSVILRRAGTSRLWDIAKSTGSTVDAIKKANALETEPAVSQILLIPIS